MWSLLPLVFLLYRIFIDIQVSSSSLLTSLSSSSLLITTIFEIPIYCCYHNVVHVCVLYSLFIIFFTLFLSFLKLILLFLYDISISYDKILRYSRPVQFIDIYFSAGTYKALRYVPTYHRTKLAGSWISKATATQR